MFYSGSQTDQTPSKNMFSKASVKILTLFEAISTGAEGFGVFMQLFTSGVLFSNFLIYLKLKKYLLCKYQKSSTIVLLG